MNLKEKYQEILPQLKKELSIDNDLAVPAIDRVVVNAGIGKYRNNDVAVEEIQDHLAKITGQKPVATLARQSIASFKIRQGMIVGYKVTLRKQRMWDFLTKFIYLALPRVRDFRGLSPKAIDSNGNFTAGVKEQIIFPELANENIKNIFGLEVCVVTTAKSKKDGERLLTLLGFPFKK